VACSELGDSAPLVHDEGAAEDNQYPAKRTSSTAYEILGRVANWMGNQRGLDAFYS
jgi:hypothetical protein